MSSRQIVIGINWADQRHAVCLFDPVADRKEFDGLDQTPEAIAEWATRLRRQFPDRPIAVCLEQSRGALAYALMKYEFLTLVPVNPKQLARFREALEPSGTKDDPTDAELLAELCAKHGDRLRVWKPGSEDERLLTLLCEDRRGLVDERTALSNQLKSLLKQYFPQALEMFDDVVSAAACAVLERWPSLQELQQVGLQELEDFCREKGCFRRKRFDRWIEILDVAVAPTDDRAVVESRSLLVQSAVRRAAELNATIRKYDDRIAATFRRCDDCEIFESFPGAGAAMAPRLLTAMGADRERFARAADVQCFGGVAPVTRRSGKSKIVRRRWACNKFLLQTFHEYAGHSLKFSAWAKAYYDMARRRGRKHQAAVRALAFKWIRILFRCWKDRTPYDEGKHLTILKRRQSPLLEFLPAETP